MTWRQYITTRNNTENMCKNFEKYGKNSSRIFIALFPRKPHIYHIDIPQKTRFCNQYRYSNYQRKYLDRILFEFLDFSDYISCSQMHTEYEHAVLSKPVEKSSSFFLYSW